MNTFITKYILVSLLIIVAFTTASYSQSGSASGEFSLQGRLTSSSGTAIADGAHMLTASVYSKVSGQVVFIETDNITTTDGIFSLNIGANGNGGSKLNVNANTDYELGISVDGQSELSPKIPLGSSLRSLTADVAANANAVGGFRVSGDSALPNTLAVLNGNGKLRTALLDSGVVTSINGVKGALNFQGGGDLSVNTVGNTVSLAFNGTGGGALNFPFTRSLTLPTGSAFSITNTLAGSAATFANTGVGNAIDVQSTTGSAINATSNGSLTGIATINATNNAGVAISAIANTSTDAALTLKNMSSSASARLLKAVNAVGTTVLDVSANGKTTISSTVGDALDVSTTSAGEAALKVTGGVRFIGAAGQGAIALGQTQSTITNALVKANSIVLVTVNGGGAAAVPLQVASQANGSFVVSVFNGLGAVTGAVSFSYLIINQ